MHVFVNWYFIDNILDVVDTLYLYMALLYSKQTDKLQFVWEVTPGHKLQRESTVVKCFRRKMCVVFKTDRIERK